MKNIALITRCIKMAIRIKMLDKEINIVPSHNVINKSSIKSGFLLADDAVVSLSYKLNDVEIICGMNEAGTAFLLPEEWPAMQFFAESDKIPSRPATPLDQPMDVRPASLEDSSEFNKYSRYLFYTRVLLKNDGVIEEHKDIKYACVPFYTTLIPHRYFVISTRHGNHQCLEEGEEIKVYNSDHVPFKVKVIFFDDDFDFIVFESDVKLCDNMPIPGPIIGGCRYVMLGFAELSQQKKDNEHIMPCYASGVIMSSQPNETGHVCGSSGGVAGLSGGPVFNLSNNDLIGICVSTDDLDDRKTSFGRFSSDMINHCKEITIVRIMPVHDAVNYLNSSIKPKKQLKRRL